MALTQLNEQFIPSDKKARILLAYTAIVAELRSADENAEPDLLFSIGSRQTSNIIP